MYAAKFLINSNLLFHAVYEPESNCKDLKDHLEIKKRNFHE